MSNALPFRLPAPVDGPVDLLVVAAEHSGDQHAARMVRGVVARDPDVKVTALGGPALAASGAQLLQDLTVNAAMGFAVFGRLSFYRALIAEVVRWVGEYQPRAVCFVDSSGLNLRIARQLFDRGFSRKAGGPTKALYYISPQIWASRAKRRFQMAAHLDGLASIFPFEREAYADTDLPVEFVGHPFVAEDYEAPVKYDSEGPVLLLPGSRKALVKRVFPILLAAHAAAQAGRPAVVLYPSEEILTVLNEVGPPTDIRLINTSTLAEPIGASAVLTTSGTMSMHCALAGIPGAVTYRTDPLTYWLGRWLVKVEYLGIANLLLKRVMYPEYIQQSATPAALASELNTAAHDPSRLEQTQQDCQRLRQMLAAPAEQSAVDWMIGQLERS